MNNKILITIIILGATGVGLLNGCNVIRDGVAMLIGAPTTDEIAAEVTRLEEAEEKLIELEDRRGEAEAAAREAQLLEDAERQRTEEIKGLYGQMAQRYTDLEGEAQDAMMRAMEEVRAQLDESNEAADRAAALVASYIVTAKRVEAEVAANNGIIDDAYANLQGFDDATAAAIGSVGGFVRTAGETAGLLGVPGSGAAAGLGSKIIEGVMTTILVAGSGGIALRQRNRRRREEGKRAEAEGTTMNLTRIVKAVDEFKLLNGVSAELKQGAKDWAGEDAHRALKAALNVPGVVADIR